MDICRLILSTFFVNAKSYILYYSYVLIYAKRFSLAHIINILKYRNIEYQSRHAIEKLFKSRAARRFVYMYSRINFDLGSSLWSSASLKKFLGMESSLKPE